MKRLALLFGILLAIATFVWFFYLVPLGCAMNTTSCRERFELVSSVGLRHFWAPLTVAMIAIFYGMRRT
ncbi:hypothetical protein [Sphingomonas dokdonensis]|uniref:Uncharacterized protein n=1 Tax=Sphingomonas dokdonensis TaxID=344880 RepID=A0A245ZE69_9SPHN|nr:hypothetical protein [Sphingomonas dokdonensis]OWK28046.1 hypothetical protein SPDO_28790 [Sphingomonas dokdonensis]